MKNSNPEMGCGGPCTSNPIKCKMPCDYATAVVGLLEQNPLSMRLMEGSAHPFRVSPTEQQTTRKNGLPKNGSIQIGNPEIREPAPVLEPVA